MDVSRVRIGQMNGKFRLIPRRLLCKPTCLIGANSRLFGTARIINAGTRSDQIVIGEHCAIRGEFFVFPGNGQIKVGDWCFIGEATRIWARESIVIGDRVLISHNCNVFDNITHPISASARHRQFRSIMTSGHPMDVSLSPKPVIIQDDAWLGAGVTLLRGVSIGRGAIVGAGAVVNADVEPWTVVVGNPARMVRRLDPEQ